ncbi:hypothetical protein K402DRAFT_12557 [Aulographum hederae CBS 113979]|uniref:Uncharacterized protein n=1 Tax=Aulographum hederae CBS 113979 TaxID=1176131 RepID=A0A6G1H7G5_9PEZI|nr:hypothetical protein K402DRAFT_12557 [Aulographum hederae CBS 113979]
MDQQTQSPSSAIETSTPYHSLPVKRSYSGNRSRHNPTHPQVPDDQSAESQPQTRPLKTQIDILAFLSNNRNYAHILSKHKSSVIIKRREAFADPALEPLRKVLRSLHEHKENVEALFGIYKDEELDFYETCMAFSGSKLLECHESIARGVGGKLSP